MATLIGLFTLGRDMEARSTSAGDRVGNLALAYNYGRKGDDGKRPTQWIDASLWGERVDALAEWLVKGAQFHMHIDDVNVQTYDRREGGQGVKLVGRVTNVEFTRGGIPQSQDAAPARQPSRAPSPPARQAPAPAPRASSGFDDMDDDIPFIDPLHSRALCLAM